MRGWFAAGIFPPSHQVKRVGESEYRGIATISELTLPDPQQARLSRRQTAVSAVPAPIIWDGAEHECGIASDFVEEQFPALGTTASDGTEHFPALGAATSKGAGGRRWGSGDRPAATQQPKLDLPTKLKLQSLQEQFGWVTVSRTECNI
eukprot:SAG31_NODE_4479_length_3200_cov_2.358916_2_plen_149_part_00